VLGLFPYGPKTASARTAPTKSTFEYARWEISPWPNGNYTVYRIPNNGGRDHVQFTLSGTYTTSSFVWTGSSIAYLSQEGFKALETIPALSNLDLCSAKPVGKYSPEGHAVGMNLWLCSGCGNVPSNGQPVVCIIRSFQFVPLGTSAGALVPRQVRALRPLFWLSTGPFFVRLARPRFTICPCRFLIPGAVPCACEHSQGANRVSLQSLGAGVHIITVPESGIVKQAIVCQ